MLTTVEGVYRDGHVELVEQPADLHEGPVLVTFLRPGSHANGARQLQYGKYRGRAVSTAADFAEAEWRGEPELDSPS